MARHYILEAKVVMNKYKTAAKTLSDSVAVTVPQLYDSWRPAIEYVAGDRKIYNGTLYKCRQAHTSQAEYTPDLIPAIWEVLDVEHAGTVEDPIPAKRNMEYFEGKYYIEAGALYLCIRNSEMPLNYLPSELIGQYFAHQA